jgi:energy-coupling factor transport system ATP-binding protein
MPIVVKNLTYKYLRKTPFEQEALRDVSLEIADGEFVGVIGKTGSGKSTLIQHFNGLLKPDEGTVAIDGVSTMGGSLKELRRKVGLVFQFPEYQLFEETVFKDIAYGISKLGLEAAEIGKRVRKAADAVGISDSLLQKSPFELSGGQKRRVAIAGVFVMEPKFLVMDEPGAGLDPAGREEMFSYVSKLHGEFGVSVILVSHNMEDVARYAERVLVLSDGAIAMDGAPQAVFRRIDELEAMGLRPPDVQYFIRSLKSIMPGIAESALTVEQAADEIESWLVRGRARKRMEKCGAPRGAQGSAAGGVAQEGAAGGVAQGSAGGGVAQASAGGGGA